MGKIRSSEGEIIKSYSIIIKKNSKQWKETFKTLFLTTLRKLPYMIFQKSQPRINKRGKVENVVKGMEDERKKILL